MTRTLLVDALMLTLSTAMSPPGVLAAATNLVIAATLVVCAWRLRLPDERDDRVTVP